LTFDLKNLIRSSVRANEYSLSVLSKLFKSFTRNHGNDIRLDELTDELDSLKMPVRTRVA